MLIISRYLINLNIDLLAYGSSSRQNTAEVSFYKSNTPSSSSFNAFWGVNKIFDPFSLYCIANLFLTVL